MELIQPFINAADAVLAESLRSTTRINDLSMEEEVYRRHGVAAMITVSGDIEGRIIFDMDPPVALAVACRTNGCELSDIDPSERDQVARETICEMANQVIGNAVTVLNDAGYQFKVHPPSVHDDQNGVSGSEDTEALVMCFSTDTGDFFMNIAMRYNRRRKGEKEMAANA
jgi:CheY-specific phosphatase CheX